MSSNVHNPGARQRAVAVAVMWFLVLACGCVHLDQAIVMRRDGSGSVSYHYSVAADTYALLAAGQGVIQDWQGLSGSGPGALNWCFDEARVRAHFGGAGLRVDRYRQYTRKGRRHVEITVFARRLSAALGTGKFGDFRLRRTAAGDVLLEAELAGRDSAAPILTPEQLQRLQPLCADLWLRLRIDVPGRIVDSSAATVTRHSATWVFDPAKDASFLLLTEPLRIRFSGEGLDWPAAE